MRKDIESKRLSVTNKVILTEFFNSQTRRPNKTEINKLQTITGISRKKILSWFAYKRFKNKN